MSAYGDKVIRTMKAEGPEKALSSVLASVQQYSDKILKLVEEIPEEDVVCFLTSIKMLDKAFQKIYPKDYSLAKGLSFFLSANALIVDTKPDGSVKHITHIQDITKG